VPRVIVLDHESNLIDIAKAKEIIVTNDGSRTYVDSLKNSKFNRNDRSGVIKMDGEFTLDYLKALVVALDADVIKEEWKVGY